MNSKLSCFLNKQTTKEHKRRTEQKENSSLNSRTISENFCSHFGGIRSLLERLKLIFPLEKPKRGTIRLLSGIN